MLFPMNYLFISIRWGVVQAMTFTTRGTLNRDMTLATFHTTLTSNMFRFEARGRIDGKTLKVKLRDEQSGSERPYEVALREVPYTAANMADMAVASKLRPGESRTLPVFDPASLGTRPRQNDGGRRGDPANRGANLKN